MEKKWGTMTWVRSGAMLVVRWRSSIAADRCRADSPEPPIKKADIRRNTGLFPPLKDEVSFFTSLPTPDNGAGLINP